MTTRGRTTQETKDTAQVSLNIDSPVPTFENDLVRERTRRSLFGDAGVAPTIDRFVLLERIGEGGMGIVYAAYDPKLDRKVALKVVQTQGADATNDTRQRRIVTEARAMAKLSHPNVVTVFEVGKTDDRRGTVYIAMEHVDGRTLRQWAVQDSPSWRETVAVYASAGRGLLAAHRAGLVHRDFKPDNVMLGHDSRVRVMDFGLARGSGDPSRHIADSNLNTVTQDPMISRLSTTGLAVGTLGYMSPEQLLGSEATASSDQFAFCIALYEALYGTRPFAGSTLPELTKAVVAGTISEAPRNTTVPLWLRKALLRGLSARPTDRFTNMSNLVAALGSVETRRRRKRWFAFIGTLALAALVGIAVMQYNQAQRTQACIAAGDVIDAFWNSETQQALRTGVVATNVSYASTAAEKIMPWADKYAESWRKQARIACESATVEDTWSPTTVAKSQWCLEERRLEFSALVTELSRAESDAVRGAVSSVAALRRVEVCTDNASLASMPPPPGQQTRTAMVEIREALARAAHLGTSGKHAEGLGLARAARLKAQRLEWPPGTATARAHEARLLVGTGAYAEAESTGMAAYVEAAQSGAWDVAAFAAGDLIWLIGNKQGRYAEGKSWVAHLSVAIAHAQDPLGIRQARLYYHEASVQSAMGAHSEAKTNHQRALALFTEALGPEHISVANSLTSLAQTHMRLSEYPEALSCLDRALGLTEKLLGGGHPHMAITLATLGAVRIRTGEYEAAIPLLEQALAIQQAALGSRHPDLIPTMSNLANVLVVAGDYPKAKALFEQALSIGKSVLGPDHPTVGVLFASIGRMQGTLGEYGDARRSYEKAFAIKEKELGSQNPKLAPMLDRLARAHARAGDHEAASTYFTRALAMGRTQLKQGPPNDAATPAQQLRASDDRRLVARVLLDLAASDFQLGKLDDAKQHLAQALAMYEMALPAEDIELATVLHNIGAQYADMGQFETAIPMLLKATQALHASPMRGSEREAQMLGSLGTIRIKAGDIRLGLQDLEQAVQIDEQRDPPSSTSELAGNLRGLAEGLRLLGKRSEAITALERSLSLERSASPTTPALPNTRWKLATILWEDKSERARAIKLATGAHEGFVSTGEGYEDQAHQVERWLAKHVKAAMRP